MDQESKHSMISMLWEIGTIIATENKRKIAAQEDAGLTASC